jgi:heptosyltransferase-2
MRIVVAQTSFLGDVVLSTPVFTALKRSHPDCHLTAWVRPEAGAVLEGHPDVDAVLLDDKRGADRGLAGFLRVRRQLVDGRFDVALALHKSLRTAALLALARLPRRIGFRQSAGWFLYHQVVRRDVALHDVERNLSLLAGLGVDPQAAPPSLLVVPNPTAVARFGALLREVGVPLDLPLVGLAPGSVWATKRWTVEGFAAVAGALAAAGHRVLLLGAPNEQGIAEEVERRCDGAAINVCGRTDVAMLVAAIDGCRLLISNDSAPMHIAVARGVPVVAIFGATHPRQGYGPYSDRAIVVQHELDCRPCGRHGGEECPIGTHECMRAIGADEVLAAARRLLEQQSSAARSVAS